MHWASTVSPRRCSRRARAVEPTSPAGDCALGPARPAPTGDQRGGCTGGSGSDPNPTVSPRPPPLRARRPSHVKPFDGVPGTAAHGCCLKRLLEKLFTGYATHCWPQDIAGIEGCRSHTRCKSLSKGAYYTTQVEKSLLPPVSLQCALLTKLNMMRAGKGKTRRAEHAHFYYLKTVNEECLGPLRQ